MAESPVVGCRVFQQLPSWSRSVLARPGIWRGFREESEAMWEDKSGHNVTIASDHPKHHDVNLVFGFHHYHHAAAFLKHNIYCSKEIKKGPCGVVANVLNCDIIVTEFEL